MALASLMLLLFLTCHLAFSSVEGKGTMDDLIRLEGVLFSNYSKDLRPVFNLSDTVHVDTTLFLVALLNFNEVSGTIHLSTVVGINWTDYRLAWNTSEYGGVTNYIANSSRIWKPRIFMISSADDLVEFGAAHFDVRIFSNGQVNFNPGKLIKSSCQVDMTYFPTDSHICRIMLVPWMHTIQEVELHFTGTRIRMDFFTSHGAWEIFETSVKNNVELTSAASIIEFSLYLKRKPQYFFLSMGVPVLLLCFLNPFVFLLPAASGERISFSVTMFLSMAVYMSSIGEVMPKVSDPIAGASYFLLGTMCFSCLLILLTILSLTFDVVSDVKQFPLWLVSMASCHRSKRNYITRKRVGAEQPTGVTDLDKITTCENKEANTDTNQTFSSGLQKNDITKFIDRCLFWISESLVIAGVCFYIFVYIKFT